MFLNAKSDIIFFMFSFCVVCLILYAIFMEKFNKKKLLKMMGYKEVYITPVVKLVFLY